MFRRVQAFTIIDLVVALIISSILTGLAYGALSLSYRHLTHYRQKTTRLDDLFFFEKTWTADWEKARYIKDAGNGRLVMEQDSAVVEYLLHDSLVIRVGNTATDTLPVWKAGSTLHRYAETMDLVERLDMTIQIENDVIPCSYTKRYPAKDLLKK